MIQHQPPSQPRWCASAATAHLFTGGRAACGQRWTEQHRRLRPKHQLLNCQSCAAAAEKLTQKCTRITSSKPCATCGKPKAIWYERADAIVLAQCATCAGRKRR